VLSDINGFVSVLDLAIPRRDTEVVALAVRNESEQLQDLADHYPDPKGGEISGGTLERSRARAAIAALMDILHRIELDVGAARFEEAAAEYQNYRKLSFAAAALAQTAEPWSLFNPALHAARQSALLQQATATTATSR
jgi:hypothetical protein